MRAGDTPDAPLPQNDISELSEDSFKQWYGLLSQDSKQKLLEANIALSEESKNWMKQQLEATTPTVTQSNPNRGIRRGLFGMIGKVSTEISKKLKPKPAPRGLRGGPPGPI